MFLNFRIFKVSQPLSQRTSATEQAQLFGLYQSIQENAYADKNDGSSQCDSESVSETSSPSTDFIENDDGGRELILTARCEVGSPLLGIHWIIVVLLFIISTRSKAHHVVTEDDLGGLGYLQFFQSCVSHLKMIFQRSLNDN